jgi:hypothetical protein
MWRSFFLPGIALPGTDLMAQRVKKLRAVIFGATALAYSVV